MTTTPLEVPPSGFDLATCFFQARFDNDDRTRGGSSGHNSAAACVILGRGRAPRWLIDDAAVVPSTFADGRTDHKRGERHPVRRCRRVHTSPWAHELSRTCGMGSTRVHCFATSFSVAQGRLEEIRQRRVWPW